MQPHDCLAAVAPAELHEKPFRLAMFLITDIGIAMGHVPGLKRNRVGIAWLGAIAMMIFGGIGTGEVVSFIKWPTIFLLIGFFVLSGQLRRCGFVGPDRLGGLGEDPLAEAFIQVCP